MHDLPLKCSCGITHCTREILVMSPLTRTGPVTILVLDKSNGINELGIVLSATDAQRMLEHLQRTP